MSNTKTYRMKRRAALLGHYRNNIRKVVDRLSASRDPGVHDPVASGALLEGPKWYPEAYQECYKFNSLVDDPTYHTKHIAWCVATLSPGVIWERNIHEAKMIYTEVYFEMYAAICPYVGNYTAYSTNVEKCREFLRANWRTTTFDDPTGPKVSAFYRAILSAGHYSYRLSETLVIDRWMLRLASGDPKIKLSKVVFDVSFQAVQDIYVERFDEIQKWWPKGVSMADFQAILWIVARND